MQELDEPEHGHLFVKRAVTRALDKHNHEREMSSILLSALYGEVGHAQVSLLPRNIMSWHACVEPAGAPYLPCARLGFMSQARRWADATHGPLQQASPACK